MRPLPCRTIACLALFACVGVSSATAQEQSPESVAAEIMAATRATDWGRMAALMHPSALRQLHELLEPILTMDDPEVANIRESMFGFATPEAARTASDSAVFVALMRFALSQQTGLGGALASSRFAPLGTIQEGSDTVHVVGRISMTVSDIAVSNIEVISLRRTGTTWRGLLKGDLTAMATALRKAVMRR